MCLCSTFTCCISPLQAGSSKEDRNSRTKCEGKGTRGVDVHSTIYARGNVSFAVLVGAFGGRAQHEAVWERGCSKGRKQSQGVLSGGKSTGRLAAFGLL